MVTRKPRIVILGAGFGGLFAARAMARLDADITLIDRHNYHLFQPLLYQVATAGLPPSDVSWPIRSILRQQQNTSVLMDEVMAVDTRTCQVELRYGQVSYDYLVIATGARHSYFGHEEWRDMAPGLKSIDDATHIRRRILLAFEQAEMLPPDAPPGQRERLLRFIVVGGGPTGVELAGTIAELARHTLAADFRRIDPRSARVVLIEAGERILPAFLPASSNYARQALEKLGVNVMTSTRVTGCCTAGVDIETSTPPQTHLSSATIIWAAGVQASPVGRWLDIPTDPSGKVTVGPDLCAPGFTNIHVIGDAARVKDASGAVIPGIAPAAKQQGRYVAEVVRRRMGNLPAPAPFVYRHAGNLATIGRTAAVIEFPGTIPGVRLQGRLAWWIWGIAHIYFLLGVPSPLVISFRWLWEYLTYSRGARLITGEENPNGKHPE